MKIEQISNTRITAEEGHVFRNKRTGAIYGASVDLGYDYYEAGIPLEEGRLQKPEDFEEIPAPEEQAGFSIDQAKRLRILSRTVKEAREHVNSYGLTAEEALELKEFFPQWGVDIHEGDRLAEGFRFMHEGSLYEARQEHTVQRFYDPASPAASGLYGPIEENTPTTDP